MTGSSCTGSVSPSTDTRKSAVLISSVMPPSAQARMSMIIAKNIDRTPLYQAFTTSSRLMMRCAIVINAAVIIPIIEPHIRAL